MGDYDVHAGAGTIAGDLEILFMDENINYVAGVGNVMGANTGGSGNGIKNMIIASTDATGDINLGWDDPGNEDTAQPIYNLTIVTGAVF